MREPSSAERVVGLERELEAARAPFVRATVVRAEAPTSARPGDVALIRGDGSVEGFVGGHCARGTVQVAALETLRTGESVLLRILPDDSESFPDVDGARVAVNPCLSGGALEIFLRPHLPPPLVAVAGESPIADAVAAVAGAAGYAVTREGTAGHVPAGASAVVLAGHTGDEGPAVRAALDAGVGYVGLVASPKRAAAILDGVGLSDDERKRVRSPAGLWIGARTPGEIAASILAEIVQEVRLHDLAPVAGATGVVAPAAAAPHEVVDPVCGMTVLVGPDTPHAVVGGEDVWFCGPGCRDHHVAQAGV